MTRNEEILRLYNEGWSGARLGERYGLTPQCIYYIVRRFKADGRAVRGDLPGGLQRATKEQRLEWARRAARTRARIHHPEIEETRSAVAALRSLGMGSRRVAACLQISVGQAAGLIHRLERA